MTRLLRRSHVHYRFTVNISHAGKPAFQRRFGMQAIGQPGQRV